MTNEKARVSQMETVIARMNNKVYADQQELMQAVLEVLCKTKDYDFNKEEINLWNPSTKR